MGKGKGADEFRLAQFRFDLADAECRRRAARLGRRFGAVGVGVFSADTDTRVGTSDGWASALDIAIRSVGVSNFGVNDLDAALAAGNVVTNQMAYSLLFRALEHGILGKCIASDVAVLAYSPLAQGLLTGKFESVADVDDERARQRFYSKNRPGTVHDAPGPDAPPVAQANVLVERSWDQPVTMAEIQAIEDAGSWCLETHRVKFVRTFFATDRTRMVCLYQAPDAESVRLAQRQAMMPVDSVWAFQTVQP